MSHRAGILDGLNEDEPDDGLRRDELRPAGGAWSGLLFDNPKIGLESRLTWSFNFAFEEIERSYGSSSVGVAIEWVPLVGASWQAMAGLTAASNFADPIESSVYFFQHHRFERASIEIVDQTGPSIHVVGLMRGDVDALGLDRVDVDAWLTFNGIVVALSDVPPTEADARARLEAFTAVNGLTEASRSQHSMRFDSL